ncbi:MAG: indolepyruvate ferredoxin oxidoreductase [Muribaculaceae bacterium]|nr:indolepyruvate ferredoxin oxidoreductase [Muribaculaceae bacterium]
MKKEEKARRLLLGDEAFALGAINSGLSGAYAYPGTPSTEIMEFIQGNQTAIDRDIHRKWSSNEKTAMEEALGMSFCGKRSIVCMKHVGMNVAADPFVNSAMTGANGGLLVVAADDPSMHSSQNEQDSRFYGDFAMIPVLEPSDQREAYNMAGYGFELSEKHGLPVLVRFVTRLSHSRAIIETDKDARKENDFHYPSKPEQWVLMPALSRKRNKQLVKDYVELAEVSETSPYNCYIEGKDKSLGIIATGIAWNYLKEVFPDGIPYSVVKISQYPLPEKMIKRLSENSDRLLVVEEGQPFVERKVRGELNIGLRPVYGKLTGEVERTGELTPDLLRETFKKIGMEACGEEENPLTPSKVVSPRPPALCKGCGHRDVFQALNEALADYESPKVFGDIGCYTLGYLAPFNAIDTVVDMGASITMAKGAADAGQHPAVAVIGDSTFTHSGMTGLLDAVNEDSPVTVIITDNLTTGMTGGQDSQGTGKLEDICKGIGVDPEHLHTITSHPTNIENMKQLFKKEIDHKGLSVIISRRECIQTARRH